MAKWRDYVEPDPVPADPTWPIEGGTDLPLYLIPEPDPILSRGFVPMFGAQTGWSPARENQSVGSCDICGYGLPDDPIRTGSKLVCMGCRRAGNDLRIADHLSSNPPPEPDEKPKPAPTRGKITLPRRFRPPSEATES